MKFARRSNGHIREAQRERETGQRGREGVACKLRVYLSHVVLAQRSVRSLRDVLCFMGATWF